MGSDMVYKCDDRFPGSDPKDAAVFFPVAVGALNMANPVLKYTNGRCFQDITFTYSQSGSDSDIGDVTVTIDVEKSRSMFCKDWFFFATASFYHVESFFFNGKH